MYSLVLDYTPCTLTVKKVTHNDKVLLWNLLALIDGPEEIIDFKVSTSQVSILSPGLVAPEAVSSLLFTTVAVNDALTLSVPFELPIMSSKQQNTDISFPTPILKAEWNFFNMIYNFHNTEMGRNK